jgi:hypothetical protein
LAKRKSSITVALERARASVTQDLITRALAEVPASTTICELVASMKSDGLSAEFEGMSISELGAAMGNGSAAPATRRGRPAKRGRKPGTKAGGAPKAKAAGGKINTRTQDGRDALDAAVAVFLQSAGSARAEAVRAAVGGQAAQVRKSLERLMAAKKVSRSGQKRGTTYHWGKAAGPAKKAKAKRKAKAGGRKKKARRTTTKKAAPAAAS